NGPGLCEASNPTKEAPGWHAATTTSTRTPPSRTAEQHTVRITTPTGHTYTSTAPQLPGTAQPGRPRH
ncbi:MAG: HNH endonuclease, partial [Arthrobacter sp.]